VINPPLPSGGGVIATTAKTKTAKPGVHVWDVAGGAVTGGGPGVPLTTSATGATCSFTGGPTFTDIQVSAKLSGAATCDSASTSTAQYPLNGKLGIKSTAAGTLAQAYVRVAGFAGQDVISLTGIVTKTPTAGPPVGATLSGETFFDPVVLSTVKPGVNVTFTTGQFLVPKGDYFFDVSQLAKPCSAGGAAVGLVYGGDGTSLLGNTASGLSLDI
jgi:hypothetical protein